MTNKLLQNKLNSRAKRKKKIRALISGDAKRPRITVFRSNRFFYAQAIDDENGATLAVFDGSKEKVSSNKEGAKKAAAVFAKALKGKNIGEVVYDRNGYLYHGVVKAFADELRNQSIKL
ncbi:MAG: 50S ribosomal protein L18 [Helicobacteraceae bacterium]